MIKIYTTHTINTFNRILKTLLFFGILGIYTNVQAQVVMQPLSEVTTTIKHYNYDDMISSTQKKVIEYIIIKSSTGEVKTTFNACDVCYAQHKGYSQNGIDLRCNNCGNRFAIDALGSQGKGGCNPGYLPHTIEGENVVFQVSDLKAGEYYFLAQTISGVSDDTKDANLFPIITLENSKLNIKMQNVNQKNYKIVDLNGKLYKTMTNVSNEFNIDISDLSSGVYILSTDEDGKITSKVFNISK